MIKATGRELLGQDSNGIDVFLDYSRTNVEYHLLETPNLIELVKEVLPTIDTNNEEQVIVERNLGRIVGMTNLVETTDADEIVYAKRIGRDKFSRFAKNRSPIETSWVVVVLRKADKGYSLWTAMCGHLLPADAYVENSLFNQTHAMAYDESLIQLDTVRTIDGKIE